MASDEPSYTRRILVTGGCGFIGSHVVLHLVSAYPAYKIVNLDRLDYSANLKNLEAIAGAPNYVFVRGSITSPDLVTYLLRRERIDTIMHFAAQTHVDNSFGNSLAFTETNILGTHVLLEAAKEARVKLFIHVSTDEVYGDGSTGTPSREEDVLEPTNPYSATKAGAEYLAKAYHRSHAVPVIITRGNNVYGPHQYPEKVIPKFTNLLIRGLPLTLHGTGMNMRNYLYVEDVARAFDLILHKGTPGDIYNIGGDTELTNIDVARAILRLMGYAERAGSMEAAEAKHVVYVKDRPFNDLRYPLDCSKLKALGWKEQVPFDAGLRLTVEWYLQHLDHWSPADIEIALSPHPRRGRLPREVLEGVPEDEHDPITTFIRARAGSIGPESTAAAASSALAAIARSPTVKVPSTGAAATEGEAVASTNLN